MHYQKRQLELFCSFQLRFQGQPRSIKRHRIRSTQIEQITSVPEYDSRAIRRFCVRLHLSRCKVLTNPFHVLLHKPSHLHPPPPTPPCPASRRTPTNPHVTTAV